VPEELPQQPSTRRTPTLSKAKKRGRPKAIPEIEEGEAERDDGQEAAPKKRKLSPASTNNKVVKESIAAGHKVTAHEVQVKDSQPNEPDENSLPTGGAKKRKKRRSIGQQSLKKTKSQGKSPLRPARQPQKRGRKSKPPQPIKPVVTRTPEPPEYSRITTPAFQDREQSRVLASVEAIEGRVGDGETLEDLGKEEVEAAELKSKKRKREPVQKEARRRAKPEVAKEPATEASKGDESPAERIQPETKAKRGPKPGTKKKTLEKAVHLQNPTEEHDTESAQTGEKAGEDVQGLVGKEIEDIASTTKVAESKEKPKPRRKKRKPIGQQSLRHRKKATDTATPDKPTSKKAPVTKSGKEPTSKRKAAVSSTSAKAKPIRLSTPVEEGFFNDMGNASHDQVVETEPVQPQKKRERPRKIDVPRISPPITKPSHPRISKFKLTKAAAPRNPPKNTIPITFYAPPSPSASDSDAMIDPLSNAPPAPGRAKGINAVDVLSQNCLEMLARTSASLADKANASPDQKAEYTGRKKTVEMYSAELEDRLFELTTTLNANSSLAAQVRKAAAEERGLKKEVKALEAEREKIKLTTEEVLKGKKARDLEKLLSGIKGAVKKGWEMEAAAKMLEG